MQTGRRQNPLPFDFIPFDFEGWATLRKEIIELFQASEVQPSSKARPKGEHCFVPAVRTAAEVPAGFIYSTDGPGPHAVQMNSGMWLNAPEIDRAAVGQPMIFPRSRVPDKAQRHRSSRAPHLRLYLPDGLRHGGV